MQYIEIFLLKNATWIAPVKASNAMIFFFPEILPNENADDASILENQFDTSALDNNYSFQAISPPMSPLQMDDDISGKAKVPFDFTSFVSNFFTRLSDETSASQGNCRCRGKTLDCSICSERLTIIACI